jgi:hypothetical protein
MNLPEEQRADALLRAIARTRRDAGVEAPDLPTVEPGDAARAARISAAVLATLPARPRESRAQAGHAMQRRLAGAAVLLVAVLSGVYLGREPLATLPDYQLEIAGADAATRGPAAPESPSRTTVTRGNRLLLVLRPGRAVDVRVVGTLWRVDGNRVVALPTPVAASAQGALFVDAKVGGDLDLPPGPHRLWLVAHDAGIDPEGSRLANARSPVSVPGLRAVAIDLLVLADPGGPP